MIVCRSLSISLDKSPTLICKRICATEHGGNYFWVNLYKTTFFNENGKEKNYPLLFQ